MKLSDKAMEALGETENIRMFVIAKDQCNEMRFPLKAWKFLYDYQEKTGLAFNEILREALVEYFEKRDEPYVDETKSIFD